MKYMKSVVYYLVLNVIHTQRIRGDNLLSIKNKIKWAEKTFEVLYIYRNATREVVTSLDM